MKNRTAYLFIIAVFLLGVLMCGLSGCTPECICTETTYQIKPGSSEEGMFLKSVVVPTQPESDIRDGMIRTVVECE